MSLSGPCDQGPATDTRADHHSNSQMNAHFAYYNEIDPYAAQWLRNLISAGQIAPGYVDQRSIVDVQPADLDGFTQCHFFAGVGIWSYALRSAGWGDDQPVWTGSCPCQPFSAAGAGLGFDDERHLWPHWHWLIQQCRPETVFGEQVASRDGLGWLDLVSSDLEASAYALGPVDTCAAGFGAFHIRQRLYFAAENLRPAPNRMVDAAGTRLHRRWNGEPFSEPGSTERPAGRSDAGGMGDSLGTGSQGYSRHGGDGDQSRWNGAGPDRPTPTTGPIGGVEHPDGGHTSTEREQSGRKQRFHPVGGGSGQRMADTNRRERNRLSSGERRQHDRPQAEWQQGNGQPERGGQNSRTRAPDPRWADADWLFCRDGKWRPIEPGTFPLAHAASARMGRLRAYGNCLDAGQAAEFIAAYLDRGVLDADAVPAGDLFEWGA